MSVKPAPQIRPRPAPLSPEAGLVGAILLHGKIPPEARALAPEDFQDPRFRLIWPVLLEVPEPSTHLVVAALQAQGQLEQAGGVSFLASLTDEPPLPSQLPAIIAQIRRDAALRRAVATARAIVSCYDRREFLKARSLLADLRQAEGEAGAPGTILAAGDLLRLPFGSGDEVIGGGVLPAGGGLILAGEAGDGKSLLRMQIAIHLAAGLDLWGLPVPHKRRVLVLQAENTLQHEAFRLRRMLTGLELPPELVANTLFFAEPHLRFNLAKAKDIEDLSCFIRESAAEVVFYDPLSSFHNVKENDNVAMRNVLDAITNINRKLDATAVVIHHFGKPTETNEHHRTRGASSIRDWTDTLAILTRKKHEHKVLRQLEFLKVRNGPEPKPLLLERDENFLHWPAEDDVLCPPHKVREIILREGGQVVGADRLQDLIAQTVGCSKRAAANYIQLAISRRAITATTDPSHRQRRVYGVEDHANP